MSNGEVLDSLLLGVAIRPDQDDQHHTEDVRDVARDEPKGEEREGPRLESLVLREDERDERAREDTETVDSGARGRDHDRDRQARLRDEREPGSSREGDRVNVRRHSKDVQDPGGLGGEGRPGVDVHAPFEILVVQARDEERNDEDENQGCHKHQDEVPLP